MKIRNGFVTNSSSSSYICEACGNAEGGYDLCLSEAEMAECENSHVICEHHIDFNEEDCYNACIELVSNSLSDLKKSVLIYETSDDEESYDYAVRSDSSYTNALEAITRMEYDIEMMTKIRENEEEADNCLYEKSSVGLSDKFDGFVNLYKDYVNEEWRHYLSATLCPICNGDIVTESSALLMALEKLGITRGELDNMYRTKYKG